MHMKIEFDPSKDRLNIAKHGISLAMADQLEWDLMMCSEDDREAYGEQRLACLAPIGNVVYRVCLVEEDDSYRIISLRKAEPKEVRKYASQI